MEKIIFYSGKINLVILEVELDKKLLSDKYELQRNGCKSLEIE